MGFFHQPIQHCMDSRSNHSRYLVVRQAVRMRSLLERKMLMTTWLITGASSGFGRIMTEAVLARGDRVVATLRRLDALDGLQARYGDSLMVSWLDVTDKEAIRRVVDSAFDAMGRIDVVVNNAGYGLFGAAEEVTDEQIRHQIDTNLVGSIQVIRAALPHLRAQGGGRILQVSSEGGQIAYPNFSLYHATKWAIEGFVEAVSHEVAPFGIAFTILEPGPAQTSFATGLVSPAAMDIYQHTPSGEMRRMLASGAFEVTGDPVKMVREMIATVDRTPAPKRLALGGTAYASIRAALLERLALLDAQKEITLSTDIDAV
jgi:NAD(P)-dependent dehydrogenase (short-subunit alcohol dehydrogenase family)